MDERQAFLAAHQAAHPGANTDTWGHQRRVNPLIAKPADEDRAREYDDDFFDRDVQRRWEGWQLARAAGTGPSPIMGNDLAEMERDSASTVRFVRNAWIGFGICLAGIIALALVL